jgi:hypothetical protein
MAPAVRRYCHERGYPAAVYPFPPPHHVWKVWGADRGERRPT